MVEVWKARDLALLDAIDGLVHAPFVGTVWRVVREGRDPVEGHPSGGRWDPGEFDVLYTSEEADGALAEITFHLARQPVFPSKIHFGLHQISVRAEKILNLADVRILTRLGVEETHYRDILYARSQAVGDAAFFLGYDGIVAPNARWPCLSLMLFTDRLEPEDLDVVSSRPVDLNEWRKKNRRGVK